MKKLLSEVLIVIFALSFVSSALVTTANAKGSDECREICARVFLYLCCGPDHPLGPGCIQIGRCE